MKSLPAINNYLPAQYESTNRQKINHNYLNQQFADRDQILEKIKQVVIQGDFTLGKEVDRLEEEFAKLCNTKHAIGVGSGTDALFLSLKAAGIGPGDEVITTPYTFYATIGAIVTSGARPVFVDVRDDANIDVSQIEGLITAQTKAIMPVHWSGRACELDTLETISERYGIPIISDACHGIAGTYKGKSLAEYGLSSCYSFHPLKNLNVWGDGGIIATNSDELAIRLRLLRNHGLRNRDECAVFAYNSRLDTIQAVVARHMLPKLEDLTRARIGHAHYFDEALRQIPQIVVPDRRSDTREVFHIYSVYCERRDLLQEFLVDHGVDAKIHYPKPMHLQPAAEFLNHRRGDFPKAEYLANHTLSLPVHEFITREDQDTVINLIKKFYAS